MSENTEGYGDVENVDEVEEVVEAPEEAPAKEAKTSKRVSIPEGYVTPIQFRNALEDSGRVDSSFKPQMVYAYVNNPGKANPFPVKWTDGENIYETREEADAAAPEGKDARPCLKEEEGFEWWDAKEARKTQRAEKKAAEETAEAEKPKKKNGKRGKKQEEVVEVVEDEAGPADDVE